MWLFELKAQSRFDGRKITKTYSICGHGMNEHEQQRRSWFASDAIKKLFSLRASHNRHTIATHVLLLSLYIAACLLFCGKVKIFLWKLCMCVKFNRKKSRKTPFLSNFNLSFLAVSAGELLFRERTRRKISFWTWMKQFSACDMCLYVRKIGWNFCRNLDCLKKICIISLQL